MARKTIVEALKERIAEGRELEQLAATQAARIARMEAYEELPTNANIPDAVMMQHIHDRRDEERYQLLLRQKRRRQQGLSW